MWNDYAGLPPFRRKDAGDYGLTDADVRRLLASGILIRLAYGLLAGYRRQELATETPQQLMLRVQAMQRRYPIGFAAFRTVALLHGLWVVGPTGPVHLVRVKGRNREKHDVWVETADLPPEDRCVVLGVSGTTIPRTVADLAGRLPSGHALAVADSALRLGTPHAALLDAVADRDDLAREIVSLADAKSQSALESMSRWLFHAANLPAPELQVPIGDDEGIFATVDFFWREQRVVGESDGLLKYDDSPDALRAEKIRQERLERAGCKVVRWGFDDVEDRPSQTVTRLADALGISARLRYGAA